MTLESQIARSILASSLAGFPDGTVVYPVAGLLRECGIELPPEVADVPDDRPLAVRVGDARAAIAATFLGDDPTKPDEGTDDGNGFDDIS